MIRLCAAISLLAVAPNSVSAKQQWAVSAQPMPPSLCKVHEYVIATCPVGRKLASVCGRQKGQAIYRFGKRGHIELESSGLRHSSVPYSGGGETQVYFRRGAYRYILFDEMVRTGFGPDGHNNPVMTSGLLLQHGERFRSLSTCPGMDPVIMSGSVRHYMPQGPFIEH